MPWWGWIVVGVVLLGSELMVPTDFFLFFLGVSALLVGLIVSTGIVKASWVAWLIYAVIALGSLFGFRKTLVGRFSKKHGDARVDDTIAGEVATVRETLAPGAVGRVELRGSTWTARNGEPTPLEAGTRARVERVEGLVLHLRRDV